MSVAEAGNDTSGHRSRFAESRAYQHLRNGSSVQSAFYAVHGEDIAASAMEFTANKVRQATVQDFASRGKRPLEASIRGQASAKSVGKDFSSMNLRELRAYTHV